MRPDIRAGGAVRPHEHPAVGLRAARHHPGAGVGRHPARAAAGQKAARRNRAPLAAGSCAPSTKPRCRGRSRRVVVTLNRLFAMLRASVQSQQQFIANTAHQLRTPITGMQAQLGSADRGAGGAARQGAAVDPAGRHPAAGAFRQSAAHPGARRPRRELWRAKNQAVRLEAIVGEVVAKFFDRALQSNIDLGVDAHPVSVFADPSLLDDLLSNLVDNALKYTPAGGSVTVSAGRTQRQALPRRRGHRPRHPRGRAPARAAKVLPDAEFAGAWQRLGARHRR